MTDPYFSFLDGLKTFAAFYLLAKFAGIYKILMMVCVIPQKLAPIINSVKLCKIMIEKYWLKSGIKKPEKLYEWDKNCDSYIAENPVIRGQRIEFWCIAIKLIQKLSTINRYDPELSYPLLGNFSIIRI